MRAHRRRTGMVFQQHQLIGRLSVLANVLTGRLGYHSGLRTLLPFSAAEKRLALAAIERVGLLDHALRRADQLSGGQQQRVGIARALAQQPAIVLADEPVASLDPATAERVLALLHRICREDGITAVVSLHQLEFARRFADRIVGLARGEVVFDGPPASSARPRSPASTATSADDGDEPESTQDRNLRMNRRSLLAGIATCRPGLAAFGTCRRRQPDASCGSRCCPTRTPPTHHPERAAAESLSGEARSRRTSSSSSPPTIPR